MDYTTQTLIYGLDGVDLKRSKDKISETRLTRMNDLVRNEDGAITARLGQVAILAPTIVTTDEIHSIGRINTPRLADFARFVGIGANLYAGSTSLALADGGYSGNTLSLLAYRPPLSSDSWMYIGDTAKMRKAKPGTSATVYTKGFKLNEFSIPQGGFDSRQRTRWSCIGFDIAANPGALAALVLPIGLPPSVKIGEKFRIDEFAYLSDGSFSARDRTRFTCFGFDIVAGAEGSFLSYATQKIRVIDYCEYINGGGIAANAWTNNAGTGGAPATALDTVDFKQGAASVKFTTAVGAAAAGYYNYWIRGLFQTAGGATPSQKDLECKAVGTYDDFSATGDKVQAVKSIDGVALTCVDGAETFTINDTTGEAGGTALTGFYVTVTPYITNPPSGGGSIPTFTVRVRLGGVNVDVGPYTPTASFGNTGITVSVNVFASRPGGGAWTIADLATVEVGVVASGIGPRTHVGIDRILATVLWTTAAPNPGGLNLSTFPYGGEIQDDDIIHIWMRLNRPDYVTEFRLYFILNSTISAVTLPGTSTTLNTDAYVKAFRPDDFTSFFEATGTTLPSAVTANTNTQTIQALTPIDDNRTGNVAIINEQRDPARAASIQTAPGRNQWTEFGTIGLGLRRGDFRRIGNNTSLGWQNVTGLCVALITNTNQIVIANIDDWYVTGGAGLDTTSPGSQRYDYRIIDYDPRVGSKSNPTEIQGEAYWLDSLRRGINVKPRAYGDINIHQRFFRRGGTLVNNWYYLGENERDGQIYLDILSDAEIVNAPTLEIDNDQPCTTVSAAGDTILAQPLPSIWGPVQDLILGCGDIYRPGHVYWCKPGEPDSWPANNNAEVCDPTEELVAGFVFKGQSFVFSRLRLHSLLVNLTTAGKVTPQPTACTHGLISRHAFVVGTDAIYFVSNDGIYTTTGGTEQNISDDTVRPLFFNQTKNGYLPVDFTKPEAIKLEQFGSDIWILYRDTGGINRVLVYSTTMKYWRFYNFANQVASVFNEPNSGAASLLLGARSAGKVYLHSGSSDDGSNINPLGRTGALDQSLPRNNKLYGDYFLKADRNSTDILLTWLVDDETTTLPSIIVNTGSGIQQYILDPFDSAGEFGTPLPRVARNLSVEFSWSASANHPTIYHGGASFIVQPDTTVGRPTEWSAEGRLTDKYIKGVMIECDTGGLDKQIQLEADGVVKQTITVNASGRTSLQFAFAEYLGRLLRLNPIGSGEWLLYNYRWIFDEEPAALTYWETQQLDHGIPGWKTPLYAYVTVKSTQAITLTVTAYNQDGIGIGLTYTIPSTAGLKVPSFVPFQATKGTLYKYLFVSEAAFWLYREESVVYVQPTNGGDLVPVQCFGDSDLDGVRGLSDAASNAARSGGGTK